MQGGEERKNNSNNTGEAAGPGSRGGQGAAWRPRQACTPLPADAALLVRRWWPRAGAGGDRAGGRWLRT